MSILSRLRALLPDLSGPAGQTEIGRRPTEENRIRYLYQQMQPDMALRATILDIRRMDRLDARVKRVHTRMARTATKGGYGWNGTRRKTPACGGCGKRSSGA